MRIRHRHVLDRVELRQQVMELKHEPDLLVAECDQSLDPQLRQLGISDRHRSAFGRGPALR